MPSPDPQVASSLHHQLAMALLAGALPGETEGLQGEDLQAATALALRALSERQPEQPAIVSETAVRSDGARIMRLAIANDDMPFLVASIAAAVIGNGLAIDRLLHPVLAVSRDKGLEIGQGSDRESLIYLEIDRADAPVRRKLVDDLAEVLKEVRLAVNDWPAMRRAVAEDAARLTGEDGALLRWLADDRLTLLGRAAFDAQGNLKDASGIARGLALGSGGSAADKAGPMGSGSLLGPNGRQAAVAWLAAHPGLLLLKSRIHARVHRSAPLDLILMSDGAGGLILYAALWTSAGLAAPASEMPVLGPQLAAMMTRHGFTPNSHAGKALAHMLTVLPHDLLLVLAPETVEHLALTAMSIADRPRSRLVLASDQLARHLFVFVWLPRDELSTQRRLAIASMLERETGASLISWASELGDNGVALLRYTFDQRAVADQPDEAALDQQLQTMVRGWDRSVEAHLAETGDAGRAARLAIRYAQAFPPAYRDGAGPAEAALDIARLHALDGPATRSVRLYRNAEDGPARLRLKLYSETPATLSEIVPALENFGFRVIEEMTTTLAGGTLGSIHRFILDLNQGEAETVLARSETVEQAITEVVEGQAENDPFNELVIAVGLLPRDVVLYRALFRYLRQTGIAYGIATVALALRAEAELARQIVALFYTRHDPDRTDHDSAALEADIAAGFARVSVVDNDRILRRLRDLVLAILRTNYFSDQALEALAFKLESARVPGLPAPRPWREIWVYSPRVEGIHLRAGPVARGGLRWSDRRDDFRTEILGLMKAQRVKNAVIVPTGAKGGFYAKQLPPPAQREAWLAEGTQSYRIFIRSLLSVTDNLVAQQLVHPERVVVLDGADPYFVVAADKGTATFSDVANAIALERGFWLGDAFASGGSVGYDHKAMGITAKGAWISVTRHFAEMGIDVQSQPVRVVGCGDMSGDVFGNGMMLSKAIRLVAAFDHRHIFLDPDPDPATSWAERVRLFALPRSSWADYDPALISQGGGVFARDAKTIALSEQVRTALGIAETELEPLALISRILTAPVDLIWFGGIGTYVKAAGEANSAVGDPANDALRVNAEDVLARVIGEGANLGITQAARIAFSLRGGRINTDFIDNSAGVDCSDNEVNIKIALNAEVAAGRLALEARNALLVRMTEDVAHLVLEDNRLQTLALSIAERGGKDAVPAMISVIEGLEATGKLDRAVEGLAGNDVLVRRAQDGQGLTRPELAVLLATAKLTLQAAIEASDVARDPATLSDLMAAFPREMQANHRPAIEAHPLRGEIVATKLANRMVNRLGVIHPFELAEEENATLGDVAAAFAIIERVYGLDALWTEIDRAAMPEAARLMLYDQLALEVRAQMADSLRNAIAGRTVDAAVRALSPAVERIGARLDDLLHEEPRAQIRAFSEKLTDVGVPGDLVTRVVRIAALDGAIGIAALAIRTGMDPIAITQGYTDLGTALGIDWAQGAAMKLNPTDPWERLLIAGLARDFQQMRLEFLSTADGDPQRRVAHWLDQRQDGVAAFRRLVERARRVSQPSTAMVAQIAGQARATLAR